MQKVEISNIIHITKHEKKRQYHYYINITMSRIVNNNVDYDIFNTCIKKILGSELTKNSVIIMDNMI